MIQTETSKEQLIEEVVALRKRVEELERKETERKQEELNRNVFESANDIIILTDRKGRILDVNEKLKDIGGYEREELLGKNIKSLTRMMTRKSLAIVAKNFLKRMVGIDIPPYEIEMIRKDGKVATVEINAVAMRRNGKIVGDLAILRDITQRKVAEKELQDSEQRYRSLFQNAHDMIQSVTPDGSLIFANRAWMETLGYTESELSELNLFNIIHPNSQAHCMELFSKVMRGESIDNVEATFVAKDGRSILIEGTAAPRHLGDKIISSQGIFRDITERRQMEDQQQLSLKVLEILNKTHKPRVLLNDIMLVLKELSQCSAVAVRLQQREDFPYNMTSGFPSEFVNLESSVCAVDSQGELLRDSESNPILECMCGAVISGRNDPTQHYFTSGGSFWTNSTTNLLSFVSEDDKQAMRMRGRCHVVGYESVALIPLKSGDEIIGLLQFNDEQRNRFTPQLIEFYEGIGQSIGVALRHQRAEEELRESEEKYRKLLELGAEAGEAVIMMQDTEQGEAILTFVNSEWLRITGYLMEELVGISFLDLLSPKHREAS